MTKKTHIPMITGMMAATVIMAAGLASCEYKDLDEDAMINMANVTVAVDGTGVDSIPSTYRVVFYPVDEQAQAVITKGYTAFDISGQDKR